MSIFSALRDRIRENYAAQFLESEQLLRIFFQDHVVALTYEAPQVFFVSVCHASYSEVESCTPFKTLKAASDQVLEELGTIWRVREKPRTSPGVSALAAGGDDDGHVGEAIYVTGEDDDGGDE